MNTAWHCRDLAVFDVESTGVDVENDRIVQAAWLVVGPGGVVSQESWLVDPGVDIPAHDALADTLTTACVAWRIARAYRLVGEMSPGQLMAFQAQAAVAWAINTETYLRTQKRMPSAVVDPSWPWRPPPTEERTVP